MWEKQGRFFALEGAASDYNVPDFMHSHTQLPRVLPLTCGKVWRIYFSTRDVLGRSQAAYVDVVAGNPHHVLRVGEQPLLVAGEIGLFDDCGVMPTCLLRPEGGKDGEVWMYYIGWNVRNTVPYSNSIGLAISYDDGQTFQRYAPGPLFAPTPKEPYFCGTLEVTYADGLYHGWYLSCVGWHETAKKPEPLYDIKYATSADGINWQRDATVALPLAKGEGGLVSATLITAGERQHMWYAYRAQEYFRENTHAAYRIGYAVGENNVFMRQDICAGIDISPQGWDDFMLSYPHVIAHDDTLFMFYNGNGFGQTGIGFATRKIDSL